MSTITATDTWPQLHELTPAASQQVFRAIMDAFARPGTVHQLPLAELPAGVPAAVLPLLALADIMTPIGALRARGFNPDQGPVSPATGLAAQVTAHEATARIARITGAPVAPAAEARFVLALDESDEMGVLSAGSHWSPETGTTLVQRVAAFPPTAADASAAAPAAMWRLTGPGIREGSPEEVGVAGLGSAFVAARGALVADYPAGIDVILVAADGACMALPRTTRIEEI